MLRWMGTMGDVPGAARFRGFGADMEGGYIRPARVTLYRLEVWCTANRANRGDAPSSRAEAAPAAIWGGSSDALAQRRGPRQDGQPASRDCRPIPCGPETAGKADNRQGFDGQQEGVGAWDVEVSASSWWAFGSRSRTERLRASSKRSTRVSSSSSEHEQVDRPGTLGLPKPKPAKQLGLATDRARKGVMESRRDRSNPSEMWLGLAARRARRQTRALG